MSSNAKLINNNEKYICNICTDEINSNVIGLRCNPIKHIFCYDCIYDWYKEIKTNKYSCNYQIKTMCPICRKNGGLLPLPENKNYEIGIHMNMNNGEIIEEHICGYKLKTGNKTCELNGLKNYEWLCKRHFNIKKKIDLEKNIQNQNQNQNQNTGKIPDTGNTVNTENIVNIVNTVNTSNTSNTKNTEPLLCVIINPNKIKGVCGVKLKTKNVYCKSLSKNIYGGFCGIHKSYATKVTTNILPSSNTDNNKAAKKPTIVI